MPEGTLVLSAELWQQEQEFTVMVTDPDTGKSEEHPLPRSVASSLPQFLAMLRNQK